MHLSAQLFSGRRLTSWLSASDGFPYGTSTLLIILSLSLLPERKWPRFASCNFIFIRFWRECSYRQSQRQSPAAQRSYGPGSGVESARRSAQEISETSGEKQHRQTRYVTACCGLFDKVHWIIALFIMSGCVEEGTLYAEGSAMMTSSTCEYCFCLKGKQACVKPRCAEPILEGCIPRFRDLACCPTHYDCGKQWNKPLIVSHTETNNRNSPPHRKSLSSFFWWNTRYLVLLYISLLFHRLDDSRDTHVMPLTLNKRASRLITLFLMFLSFTLFLQTLQPFRRPTPHPSFPRRLRNVEVPEITTAVAIFPPFVFFFFMTIIA